ncbi:hypothetical protein G9A89_010928 [Geosiphon pyriformis]|nr:hypothetical protein G9A89_010928 [Geosiphon pyriformis]
MIILFYATTEQLTFFGLFLYRLKQSWATPILFFSGVQVLITKIVHAHKFYAQLCTILILIKNQINDIFSISHFKDQSSQLFLFNIIFPLLVFGLFISAIWSTYIIWFIAMRSRFAQSSTIKSDFNVDPCKFTSHSKDVSKFTGINNKSDIVHIKDRIFHCESSEITIYIDDCESIDLDEKENDSATIN